MYFTNLPIQSISSVTFPQCKVDPSEIWITVDSYIINVRVWTRTSQLYMMEQQPKRNIKLETLKGNPLRSPNAMIMLEDNKFMIQRSITGLEIVSPLKSIKNTVSNEDSQVLAFSTQVRDFFD